MLNIVSHFYYFIRSLGMLDRRFVGKIVLSFPVPINQAGSLLCNHIDVYKES